MTGCVALDTQRVPTQANSSNGRAKALLSQFPMTSEGKYKPIFVTKKPTSTKFIPPTNKFIPMQKSKGTESDSRHCLKKRMTEYKHTFLHFNSQRS